MNVTRNWLGAGLLLLAIALVIAGCGTQGPRLEGAVYAEQIPVYPPASLTGQMSGRSSDFDGSALTSSTSWWLEAPHAQSRVEAWYEQRLPQARKSREDWGDGIVTVYTWTPEGGQPGDELSITITREEIQITETLRGERERP